MAVLNWNILIIFFLCMLGIVNWVVKPGKDNKSDWFLSGRLLPEPVMGTDFWFGTVGLVLLTGIFSVPASLRGILTNSVLLPNIQIKHGFTCFSGFGEQIAEVGNRWNGWHVVNSPGE
jgi:Na+/proline symporter